MDERNEQHGERIPRRERERARRHQEIMAAAVRVFSRRGFATSTLDEVAQEAEFSKGALYLYFSSKEDILFNILLNLGTLMRDVHRECLTGKRSLREELSELYTRFAKILFAHLDETKILMTQFMSGYISMSEEGQRTLLDLHHAGITILSARVQKARETGEIRDIPIHAITAMVHGSLDTMATTHWHMTSIDQVDSRVQCFIDILFRGIAKESEKCV